MTFSTTVLNIDPAREIFRITEFIHRMTHGSFKRRGAVVGLSGGIDSAVTAALCVRALGKDRVLGVLLPEKESNPISLEYGRKEAERLGIRTIKEDITAYLGSFGIYERRNAVIKEIFPEFNDACRFHVTLPQNLLEQDRLNYYSITMEDPAGKRQKKRISSSRWQQVSACQNVKQRVRMVLLYHYAEREKYLVAGTTNRSETAQGFFVKFGDGGVDIEPLAHLYKTQVYQLANSLGVIEEIIHRAPSPDTYSLPVTDKEFYFCLDYNLLDLLLYGYEHAVPVDQIVRELCLKKEEIERVFKDFRAKEQATWHLRSTPPTLEA
ncbi:MAG: NAD(+) synthase [Deltaproteobacteria bacterium]|nr:NAD(+) synthase [Deltaproteobacteria bacterium]